MPTPSNTFRLRLQPDTDYNFSISWGDGSKQVYNRRTPTSANLAILEKVYGSGGIKQISITENVVGGFPKPYFDGVRSTDTNNDARKVTKIIQWGRGRYSNLEYSFAGCTNLQITATDGGTATINQVTSIRNAFDNCTSLTSFPSNFNTSNVTNFNSTWRNCSNITNFPLLNMNKMTEGIDCFINVKLPTERYSQLLTNLATNNLNPNVVFHAGQNTNYFSTAIASRNTLMPGRGWNITDGGLVYSLTLTKTGGTLNERNQFAFFTTPAGLNCGSGCSSITELFGASQTVELNYNVTPSVTCPNPVVFYSVSRNIPQYEYIAGSGISMVGNGILTTGGVIGLGTNSGLLLGGSPAGAPYKGGDGITVNYKDIDIPMSGGDIIVTAEISCA